MPDTLIGLGGLRSLVGVLAVTALAWGCGPGVVLIAADTFDAELRNGWGATDSGGLYTLVGERADFDVTGGVGTILLQYPATPRAAYLSELRARDYMATIRVSTDRPASGGRQFLYFALRRTDEAEYLAKLSFDEGGEVFLEASRLVRAEAEEETPLGPEIPLPRALHEPGTWFTLQADITGIDPTTLRVRAWQEGQSQPDWQITVTDALPQLQQAGTVGIRARLGRGIDELPVVVSVDDLRVGH